MRDHFIETNGQSVTLKKIASGVWDTYDQLDVDATSWNNSTIKVLLSPGTGQKSPSQAEGFVEGQQNLEISFKSDCTVAIGDYIEINSVLWRVEELNSRTYQGMTVKQGMIAKT